MPDLERPEAPPAELAEVSAALATALSVSAAPSSPFAAGRRPTTALLVDYPVVLRAIRAIRDDAVPRLDQIVLRASALGPLLIARAYGAWYTADEALSAFSQGLDPVFVPPAGPGIVPTTPRLLADGLALVRSGRVRALCLSGDDRLLPLMTAAREAGCRLALVAHACEPGSPCLALAEFAEPAAAFARAITRAEKYRRGYPAGQAQSA